MLKTLQSGGYITNADKKMAINLTVKTIRSINEVDRMAWNALTNNKYPFLRHEFLSALENHGCLGGKTGWIPEHLVFQDNNDDLVAAIPMYLKFNSFGEFVFDWSWADAYRQAGLSYYPKLVGASPFTPATSPKILMSPKFSSAELFQSIIDSAIDYTDRCGVSSVHWLFTSEWEAQNSPQLLVRTGYQFHWGNREYQCFDDFLANMASRKRKQIKKERRQARESGVEIRLVPGTQLDLHEWQIFHNLYSSTFIKYSNYPALTLAFFIEIAESMGDQILVALARRHDKIIAASFFFVGEETLYGRYWGCVSDIPGLHFETCYYQGLEYCINRGLKRFEPGAQGEHKISRGFLPTKTWSLHWIRHPQFRLAIMDFLRREKDCTRENIDFLNQRSPFKQISR